MDGLVTTTTTMKDQWKDQEDGILLLQCLEYLDVVTLIKKKPVCKDWQRLCTKAIDGKCTSSNGKKKKKKKFESNTELRLAVNKYSPGDFGMNGHCSPTQAEEIASSYGYPIDRWDVSNINDFFCTFGGKYHFNEPIGSWDVSNATTMEAMFYYAESFNQDISSWDVSKVTNMCNTFSSALSLNQDISSWDVSNVTNMKLMFRFASSFNQDISSWDVSKVTNMTYMFNDARSFNQDLLSWDTSNVTNFYLMFEGSRTVTNTNAEGPSFDVRRLPWFTLDMLA